MRSSFRPSTRCIRRGDATSLVVQGAALGFEGQFRPGHFNSVATVCVKLFNIVQPDVAFFGQKDAQQVAVIRQTVRDLRLNLQVAVVPTVRESDGLALSSRNVRLSSADRLRALAIPRALAAGLTAHIAGTDPAAAARGGARRAPGGLRRCRDLRRPADVSHRGPGRIDSAHRQRPS